MSMSNIGSIMLGGAVGALLRYLISGATYKLMGSGFPWGTLTVNLSGSFLIGMFTELFDSLIVQSELRVFILIGLLGSFTTFSTFSLESLKLIQDGQIKFAVFNILINNITGIILVIAGIISSRFIINLLK